MLKKIYKALPKKVTQFYKKARKHIMLRFVFPMTYKHSARGKEIQDKKVVLYNGMSFPISRRYSNLLKLKFDEYTLKLLRCK